MAHRQSDPRRTRVRPLAERRSKHTFDEVRVDPQATPPEPGSLRPALERLVEGIRAARAAGRSVILAYGAHLIKNGLGPVVADLVAGGWVTHLATHGAGTIHDWEYAYQGRSEEDVRAHLEQGCFGTWDETGRIIHVAVLSGALRGMGYGESLGRLICDDGCWLPAPEQLAAPLEAWSRQPVDDPLMPARAEMLQAMLRFGLPAGWYPVRHRFPEASLTAAACRLRVPLTVHPGIGYDIIYTHPMANGAALGRAAGIDFNVLVHSVGQLDGGVFLSVGSAVMAPQVFEKALSVANNQRRTDGLPPLHPLVVVNDLAPADWDWTAGEPPASHPAYYVRFAKSFSRSGGEMVYARGDNRALLANLRAALQG